VSVSVSKTERLTEAIFDPVKVIASANDLLTLFKSDEVKVLVSFNSLKKVVSLHDDPPKATEPKVLETTS